jgi:uncharacterized membrane-anchored protein
MIRALYTSLLRLHPPAFHRRFASEMLWIFDETRLSHGTLVLLFDLLISVMRQWLHRSGVWKAALALALGAVQVTAGGFGWFFFNPRIATSQGGAQMTPIMDDLMRVTLWSFGIVFVAVFVSTLSIGRLNRKRLAPRRRH